MNRSLSLLAAGLATALTLAGTSGAAKLAAVPRLPPGWSHAEINVVVKHVPHTLIYDHGRVVAVTPTSITLREPDGSVQVIGVSAASQVTIDGQPGSVAQIRRLEMATTLRVDGGDATRVTVRVPAALAAALARRGGN